MAILTLFLALLAFSVAVLTFQRLIVPHLQERVTISLRKSTGEPKRSGISRMRGIGSLISFGFSISLLATPLLRLWTS